MTNITIETPIFQGRISVWDSNPASQKIPVICIHGNSTEKNVFHKQFEALGDKYRLIAIDLPGHGNSHNATNPLVYSIRGYANVIFAVMNVMQIPKATIFGWSLGGHIGIEMYQQQPSKIAGLCITGTPPIPLTPEGFHQGFNPIPAVANLINKYAFTDEEAVEFIEAAGIDLEQESYLLAAAKKTDGSARVHLIDSMLKGEGVDQKEAVETSSIPLAVIAGINDAGVNNNYLINQVKYKNLWEHKVHVIPGAGHAPFLNQPEKFNTILTRFLDAMQKLYANE